MDTSYQPPAPKKNNTTLIIIIVVAVVLLLCCCCAVAAWFGFDPLMQVLRDNGIISFISGLFI